MAYLRPFWVKEPRHSENVVARKRYTSTVACAFAQAPEPKLPRPVVLKIGTLLVKFLE